MRGSGMRGDATTVDTKQLACCGAEDDVDAVGCLQPQNKIAGSPQGPCLWLLCGAGDGKSLRIM
jgi:hypothetical protein